MIETGFLGYAIGLFLLSGFLLLMVDNKIYEAERRGKEQKISRWLGWTQLSLAVALAAFYFGLTK